VTAIRIAADAHFEHDPPESVRVTRANVPTPDISDRPPRRRVAPMRPGPTGSTP
jgi:hypothetical protein